MSFRDDHDALAARHAALALEIERKQRELDEVAAMLADARRLDQAETHFADEPVRRRRRARGWVAGAFAALVAGGVGLGVLADDGYAAPDYSPQIIKAALDQATAPIREDRMRAVRAAIPRMQLVGGPRLAAGTGRVSVVIETPEPVASGSLEDQR